MYQKFDSTTKDKGDLEKPSQESRQLSTAPEAVDWKELKNKSSYLIQLINFEIYFWYVNYLIRSNISNIKKNRQNERLLSTSANL